MHNIFRIRPYHYLRDRFDQDSTKDERNYNFALQLTIELRMHKLIFAGWVVSLLVFLGILLLTYAYFSEEVMVYQNFSGEEFFLTRHQIFYFALFSFAVINALIYVFARTLSFAPGGNISVRRIQFRSWLYGFSAVINVFFIFSLSYISLINSSINYSPEDLAFMVYVAPILLAGSLIWLFIILLR